MIKLLDISDIDIIEKLIYKGISQENYNIDRFGQDLFGFFYDIT